MHLSCLNQTRTRRAFVAGFAVSATFALAACGPGAASGGSSADANPTNVSTAVPKGDVTLKLYDGQGLSAVDNALIAAFEKKYSNITIKPTYDPDDVTTQNQPRQLASSTPPDLIRVISVTGGTKNNLLTNLDAYSKAYGWDQLPAGQLTQFREANGVAGSGSLYAKPSGFTMTGLYYNKKLASQLGMTTAPTSVADLQTLMAKAKAAGLTAMVVANKDGGGVFPYQLLINSALGPQKVSQWVFNAKGATIDTSASVAAAKTVQDWNKAGYFPSGVNGLDATGADALFAKGKAVFYPWGNWDATNLDKTVPGNVGFIPMPPAESGGAIAAMSDAATAFGIPTKSKNRDAAALFLNFLSSDEARQVAVDNGFMPIGTASQAAPTIKTGSVLNDVVSAFNTVSKDNGQVPFVQNATPGISNQGWNPQIQLLLGDKTTPEAFVKTVQSTYEQQVSQ